ncbi:hypothetical protein QZH41_011004 [Actinostola sp. cb2023]|nr:hypothetical protein QZH41_011004 [Actinostola sp. cb2023]
MANPGGFTGSTQASPLLSSSRKFYKSDKSSLSGSYESPKSYGSTTKPVRSEADTKIVGHVVESFDTLQGLSIKYGVSVEDIRRINKLWTNDNIHFYKIIKIPVRTESKFADLDDSDLECDMADQNDFNSVVEADSAKEETPSKSSSSGTANTTDSVTSFLDQLDLTIKKNVRESEKLRSQTAKNIIGTLEGSQGSNATQDDLFRPLSFSSTSQHRLATGRRVNKAKSDMLNSEEHLFEL